MALRKATGLIVCAALVAAMLAGVVLSSGAEAARKGPLRMNQIQVIGTHNSYHRELSPQEQAEYDEIVKKPGDYQEFLAYSHASIPNQFATQEVRGLELDLFPDPEGGLYEEPLVRKRLGLGPLPDPAWQEPGVKVLHIADLDYETTCVRLVSCLGKVESWSSANPRHVPILIMLELKQSDPRAVAQGGVVAPPWDATQLDALDAEIRSVFDERDVITPDDVRRPPLTLEQTVRRYGWPRLEKSRGKVAFLLDNEGPLNDLYAAGRPNLEGRVIFTNSTPGKPDAAFLKRNEPRDANTATIQDLVRKGYLVRTRSDLPLSTVRSGDTEMLEAALASGAHLISTDFPEVGMSARYGSDYVARLPQGGTARCNPVNAPKSCRSDRLERR
ncbi:MAG: phosphatidylinositol-specific phospholipase C1-like protein [Rubrobacter sp.]